MREPYRDQLHPAGPLMPKDERAAEVMAQHLAELVFANLFDHVYETPAWEPFRQTRERMGKLLGHALRKYVEREREVRELSARAAEAGRLIDEVREDLK